MTSNSSYGDQVVTKDTGVEVKMVGTLLNNVALLLYIEGAYALP